ncbi:hypothetical protein HMN09_00895400 [Mycena chlorophos]|uniref:Transcription initiation factor TFIID subunit 4 n=1 Tax=Mycena chlorophos TaxID=658473 RepID=A0A8H6W207_MYCCL|nr:hypothetical protein HMN09_00895400 [Mycena chlorophos]
MATGTWDSSAIPIDPALQAISGSTPDYVRPILDRTTNGPLNPNFDASAFKPRLDAIAAHHKLSGGCQDVTARYLAAALRIRLEELVKQMRDAAMHRTDTLFDQDAFYDADSTTPMWSIAVRSDVSKQAALLEKLEREEEQKLRRERKERADLTAAHAAALAAQAAAGSSGDFDDDGGSGGGAEGGKRKKKKGDGPGVTARNMSEDVRKKMSNAVASQAAGIGGKYSWMNATNAAAASAKPIRMTNAASSTPSTPTPAPNAGGGWARAYGGKTAAAATPTASNADGDSRTAITLRDAQFVVHKERGHGGGRGSGLGWT